MPEIGSTLKLEALLIALVNPAAFVCACKLEGSLTFQLDLSAIDALARSAKVTPDPVDLENIPEEYHDFADVFSKEKADVPAPH